MSNSSKTLDWKWAKKEIGKLILDLSSFSSSSNRTPSTNNSVQRASFDMFQPEKGFRPNYLDNHKIMQISTFSVSCSKWFKLTPLTISSFSGIKTWNFWGKWSFNGWKWLFLRLKFASILDERDKNVCGDVWQGFKFGSYGEF